MSGCNRHEREEQSIAVIGAALRIPGASSLEAFWDNLLRGRVCREHLSEQSLSTGPHAGICQQANYVPYRYSINGYDAFDAAYFQMSPREASLTDPQHRLILEYATRAFENAGYVPTDVGDTKTAVFACSDVSHYLMGNVYPHLCAGSLDVIETFIGTGHDFLATRVAYKCNFKGPAMTVQTACSSSLSSLHMAVLSLLAGECDRAVVASSTVLLPDLGYAHHPGGIHSPDGLCRPFDHNAEGTVFSNGVVGVVLKPLLHAVRDRDHIWAVVRGTASANDGSDKIGFVAPSASGQARAIRSALAVAGCAPEDIAYVEGHGTGTQLGDPIEMDALLRVFAPAKARCAMPIILGSVKGNVGHLNATAGLCGFLKTCLCLYHGIAPGTANFTALNPAFGAIEPFTVSAKQAVLRRRSGGPLLAGVSAFGFGGTNVHAVLQEPPRERSTGDDAPGQARLFPISAPTRDGVRQTSALCADRLGAAGGALLDAAYTLAVGRRQHAWRRAIVAQCAEHARRLLLADVAPVRSSATSDGAVAFMFPGQGNLHPQAGYDFYAGDPLFRERLDNVAHVILANGGPDVVDVMKRSAADADAPYYASTAVAQPVLFAFETAFAESLVARGVEPDCVLGHSLGEYAAAVQAGIFSLEHGARLVVQRAALMQAASPGKMLMVTLNRAVLRDVLGDLCDSVELSVVNGPSNCVLSGQPKALEACKAAVERYGQRCVYLKTSHAFHSVAMEAVLEPFRRVLEGVAFRPPSLPIVSNVSGSWGGPEMATPLYWLRHLRHTVEFDRCLATLADRVSLGIEVGPGHVMRSLGTRPDLRLSVCSGLDSLEQCAGGASSDADTGRGMAHVVGGLWEHGGRVDWRKFYAAETPWRCPMPETALNPRRYWIDPVVGSEPGAAGGSLSAFVAEQAQASGTEHLAPENDVERLLVAIWQELLLIRPIGTDEEFLALGGNSVQVMQMLRMAKDRGLVFSVKDVFEAKTVKELARRVSRTSAAVASNTTRLKIPAFMPAHAGENAGRQFHAVFDCPEGFGPAYLGRLAKALAERHEVLRLRWGDERVVLRGPTEVTWAREHVLDAPALADEALAPQKFGLFLSLPAQYPVCRGDMPWYLASIADNGSGRGRFLAVVSWALCDMPGFAELCREIEQFARAGALPEQEVESWNAWGAALPECALSGSWGRNGCCVSPAVGMAATEKQCSVLHRAGIRAMIEEAARKTRLSPGVFAAYAAAGALRVASSRLCTLTLWKNVREGAFPVSAGRHAVGPYAVPLHIKLEDAFASRDAGVPCFKSALRRAEAELLGGVPPASGDAAELYWMGFEEDGDAASRLRFSIAPAADGARREPLPQSFYAYAGRDSLTVVSSDASEEARALRFAIASAMAEQAEQVIMDGVGRQIVPDDFPLCDLTVEELNRIIEETGRPLECAP